MESQHIFRSTASMLVGLTLTIAVGKSAAAQDMSCPLPGQKPTLLVKMFFGQSIKNRGPVTPKEWNAFLRRTVTPRLPDGFTVYNAYGQWLDTDNHAVVRESSKVIEIAAADTAPLRTSITEVADAYRKLFRQQAVAIVTTAGCSVF